jgi:hypothetical protein
MIIVAHLLLGKTIDLSIKVALIAIRENPVQCAGFCFYKVYASRALLSLI